MLKEEFTSSDWSHMECEAMLLIHVDLGHTHNEAPLYETKFWDYRPLHPLQATILFAEHYKDAIKHAIKARVDYWKGLNYKGLKHENLLDCGPQTISGMHKARQMADSLGVPYNIWCYKAMEYARKRDYRFLPQPKQLYSNKPKFENDLSMVEFILDYWQGAQRQQPFFASHPFYHLDNYCGHSYQILHQRHVLNYIRKSVVKPDMIANYVYDKKLLFEIAVKKAFGERAESYIRQAKKIIKEG